MARGRKKKTMEGGKPPGETDKAENQVGGGKEREEENSVENDEIEGKIQSRSSELEADIKTDAVEKVVVEEDGGKDEADGDEDEDDEVFEVEKILARHHYYRKHYYYYVKWKGYDDETDNTWEPRENLDGCPLLREEFDTKMENLEKEDEKEFKRQTANTGKLWRKYGGKAVAAGGIGEEEEEKVVEKEQEAKAVEAGELQPSVSDGNAVAAVETISTASLSKTPNPRKRKSEDDDDVDVPRDSSAKKPKLTTNSFMKNWLEKGSKSKNQDSSPITPTSSTSPALAASTSSTSPTLAPPTSSTSPTLVAPTESVSSPALKRIESFNKLFKTPDSTKKSVSETTIKKVFGSSSSSSEKNDSEKKSQQQKALKRWENEMNSISKDPGKIVVENNADLDGPPTKFTYINDYLPFDDIVFPDDPLIGCECQECDVKGCCPDNNDAPMAYNKYKRLRNYASSKEPVWECNRLCK